MKAYVQIALDGAKEDLVYDRIRALSAVKELHVLFGEWDMIVKLELSSPEELGAFVLNNIRPIPGVRMTSTMIVAR